MDPVAARTDVVGIEPVRFATIRAIPSETHTQQFAVAQNQTLEGQVVSVDGDSLILSIGNQRVAARADADVAAGETLRLLVRETGPDQVLMQIVARGPIGGELRSMTSDDLSAELTRQGLAADPQTIAIARQLITRGLPVSAQNVLEVRAGLARAGGAGIGDVDAAVFLKAQNLPITRDSLQIVRQALASGSALGQQVEDLRGALAGLAARLVNLGAAEIEEPGPSSAADAGAATDQAGGAAGQPRAGAGAPGQAAPVAGQAAARVAPQTVGAAATGAASGTEGPEGAGQPGAAGASAANVTAGAAATRVGAAQVPDAAMAAQPPAGGTAATGTVGAQPGAMGAPPAGAGAEPAVPAGGPAAGATAQPGATVATAAEPGAAGAAGAAAQPSAPGGETAAGAAPPGTAGQPATATPGQAATAASGQVGAPANADAASAPGGTPTSAVGAPTSAAAATTPGAPQGAVPAAGPPVPSPGAQTTNVAGAPGPQSAAGAAAGAPGPAAAATSPGAPGAAPAPATPTNAAPTTAVPARPPPEPPSLPRLFDAVTATLEHLALLDQGAVDAGGAALAERIRQVVAEHGTPVEAKLARVLEGIAGQVDLGHNLDDDLRTLLTGLLDQVNGHIEQAARPDRQLLPDALRDLHTVRGHAESLLGSLELQQLANAAPAPSQNEHYLVFQLPIPGGREPQTAQIRVRQETDRNGQPKRIDPNNVHVVFQFELEHLRTVRVGIRVVDRHVSCQIGSSDPEATALLTQHADELRQGLSGLGYAVDSVRCAVLTPEELAPPAPSEPAPALTPPRVLKVDARA